MRRAVVHEMEFSSVELNGLLHRRRRDRDRQFAALQANDPAEAAAIPFCAAFQSNAMTGRSFIVSREGFMQ